MFNFPSIAINFSYPPANIDWFSLGQLVHLIIDGKGKISPLTRRRNIFIGCFHMDHIIHNGFLWHKKCYSPY